MSTGPFVEDIPLIADMAEPRQHPMDSSRLLLGLMSLARRAEVSLEEPTDSNDPLSGIISRSVLKSLLAALHFRDASTVRHARRVAMLATGMAQYLGWEGRHLHVLEVAALLHDIGKIGVPDNILFKPGKLNPDEAELMALHHNIALDVMQACKVDKEVLEIAVQAHRHYNGAEEGYRPPRGIMHQGARILAVADAYDSLSHDQVYRGGLPHVEIMNILTDSSGTRFDGSVVSALSRWKETGLGQEELQSMELTTDSPTALNHPQEALEASTLGHIFSYLYVLESLYDGFYLVDSDLNFVVWNRGLEQFLARSAPEMLGQTWTTRLLGYSNESGELLADNACPMHQVLNNGRPMTPTVHIQHKNGHLIEVEVQSVPLFDAQGQLQGVAEIIRDLARSHQRPNEYRELKLAASRDPLTGVANRGELETQLGMALSTWTKSRDAEPFSVIFLDIDFFKNLNDTFGHTTGDQVLVDAAKLLRNETYSGEIVGRYGGEEFVIICPSTDLRGVIQKAERLRNTLSFTEIGGLENYKVTASFGVTEVESGDSIESILRRADKALYQAKETGRNKVCSMTGQEFVVTERIAEQQTEEVDQFVYRGTLQACIAADMLVYKLGGFVSDEEARLVKISEGEVVIRQGSRGIIPIWGGSENRQPVEIVVEFDTNPARRGGDRRSAARRVTLSVQIRPLGYVWNMSVFQRRARRVMKLLRCYLVAD